LAVSAIKRERIRLRGEVLDVGIELISLW